MRKSVVFAMILALLLGMAAVPALAAEYNIRLSHNLPATDDSLYHQAALKFKEEVEKLSGGKVAVEIFPSSQLGSDMNVAKKVQIAALEMEILSANKLGAFYPGMDLYSLPFLFTDFDQAARVFKSPVHAEVEKELLAATGLKSLAFVAAGYRNITNSKHAVNKPEDLRDLKIRVPKNKIEIATFEALGANPVNIQDSELFSALQQGVVDGQDGSAAWAYAKKVFEVQKYLAVTHHQLSTSTMIISARYFDGLPADIQKAIVDAAKATEPIWQKASKDSDETIIQRFAEHGMEVTKPDLEPFKQAVHKVYEEFAPQVGGMERIQAVMAVK